MKCSKQLTIILFSLFLGLSHLTIAQCTPGDSTTCPDPEDNGQICPKMPAPVYIGVEYQQQITILPPPKIDTNNMVIPIHHITLLELGNLPEGITWQSNAEKNEFMAGTYYCVILAGTTSADTGNYPVKIIIEAFGLIANTVVSLGQTIDSTSITLHVKELVDGIADKNTPPLIKNVWPNPFSKTLNIDLEIKPGETAEVEIYNLIGVKKYHMEYKPLSETYNTNLSFLPNGIYIMSINYNGTRQMKKIIKYHK
ncbi:MAG: T9SS type A sorting domain-containing protein [Bacteroidota bacterium]